MCSMYWNLNVRVTCPACGRDADDELQTHFMGEPFSCDNIYEMGEPVAEMAGFNGVVKPPLDDLIGGGCETAGCDADFVTYGFKVEDGRVMKVWPLRYWKQRMNDDAVDVSPDEQERLAVLATKGGSAMNDEPIKPILVIYPDPDSGGFWAEARFDEITTAFGEGDTISLTLRSLAGAIDSFPDIENAAKHDLQQALAYHRPSID